MNFKQQLQDKITLIDKHLEKYLPQQYNEQKDIYEAMRYSLFAGGKRLRPAITLACCEMLGGNLEDAMPFACALEMIHTYSLIHDDLPAMDNDDYRRGKPTNHKVYGEALAILAGDALLNKAFEITTSAEFIKDIPPQTAIAAVAAIAQASGTEGMIGGQVVDMKSENQKIDQAQLTYMHSHKTGALIIASAKVGALIAQASQEQMETLTMYAHNIGLAFQIKDDILDVEGSQEKLGKPIGSDTTNQKSTFVTLAGLEEAKKQVTSLTQDAIQRLEIFGQDAHFLIQLAEYLIYREH